jgi:hypothetical protein
LDEEYKIVAIPKKAPNEGGFFDFWQFLFLWSCFSQGLKPFLNIPGMQEFFKLFTAPN